MAERICSIENCERPKSPKAGYGLCGLHYGRWQRHGDVLADVPVRTKDTATICAIEDCGKPRYQKSSLCVTHHMRRFHYGDPLIDKSRAGRTWQTSNGYLKRGAPGHPLADGVGAVAVHRLVLYEAIGPGQHPCHWCTRLVMWMPGEKTKGDALITDHLDGDKHNNVPANLVPSCHGCNTTRSRWGDEAAIARSCNSADGATVRRQP